MSGFRSKLFYIIIIIDIFIYNCGTHDFIYDFNAGYSTVLLHTFGNLYKFNGILLVYYVCLKISHNHIKLDHIVENREMNP